MREVFDLRPAAIIRDLDLRRPIYRKTAAYGHFGRRRQGVHLGADQPARRRSRLPSLGCSVPLGRAAGRPGPARRARRRQDVRLPGPADAARTACASAPSCASPLHGRRVGGWVVGRRRRAAAGRRRSSRSPRSPAGAARRRHRPGRLGGVALGRAGGPFLRTASPAGVGGRAARRGPAAGSGAGAARSLGGRRRSTPAARVVRLPPGGRPARLVLAAAGRATRWWCARRSARRAGSAPACAGPGVRRGAPAADWARAAAGAAVVSGAGRGVGAVPRLAAVVVLDEHDEVLPGGAGADLARPRRRRRAGPAGRRAVRARLAVPVARGPGRGGRCSRRPAAEERAGLAGRRGRRPPPGRRRWQPRRDAALVRHLRAGRPGGRACSTAGAGPAARLRGVRRAGPLRACARRPWHQDDDGALRLPPLRRPTGRWCAGRAAPAGSRPCGSAWPGCARS